MSKPSYLTLVHWERYARTPHVEPLYFGDSRPDAFNAAQVEMAFFRQEPFEADMVQILRLEVGLKFSVPRHTPDSYRNPHVIFSARRTLDFDTCKPQWDVRVPRVCKILVDTLKISGLSQFSALP